MAITGASRINNSMIVDMVIFLIFPPINKILVNLLLFPPLIVVLSLLTLKCDRYHKMRAKLYSSIRKREAGNVGNIMFYEDESA